MMLPGNFFFVFWFVSLKKAGECAEIEKELKEKKYKKRALLFLLHPNIIYLPASIASQQREHLSRAPRDLSVSCCCSLLAQQLHRQCWQLRVRAGGYTRPLERSFQFHVFPVFTTFSQIFQLIQLLTEVQFLFQVRPNMPVFTNKSFQMQCLNFHNS